MQNKTSPPEDLDLAIDEVFVSAFQAVALQAEWDMRALAALVIGRRKTGRGPDLSEIAALCVRLGDMMRFAARNLPPDMGLHLVRPGADGDELDGCRVLPFREARECIEEFSADFLRPAR